MNAVKPVTITIAGVDRSLRFTLGARKRIRERFGMGFKEALEKLEEEALAGIVYAALFDEKSTPPDITEDQIAEAIPACDAPAILAAIFSAATNGAVEKNALEAVMLAGGNPDEMKKLILSDSSPSPINASESKTEPSFGTDSSSAN